jgi:hypothetical protein
MRLSRVGQTDDSLIASLSRTLKKAQAGVSDEEIRTHAEELRASGTHLEMEDEFLNLAAGEPSSVASFYPNWTQDNFSLLYNMLYGGEGAPAEAPPAAPEETTPEGPTVEEHVIPTHNLPWLEKQIKKINNIIRKVNANPAAFGVDNQITPVTIEKIEDANIEQEGGVDLFGEEKRGKIIPASLMRITFENPKINGWSFVASMTSMEEGGKTFNIIKANPEFEKSIPEEFREADFKRCDVCRKKVRRITTFLVYHPQKEFMMVGRNCLGELLDVENPGDIAKIATAIEDLFSTIKTFGGDMDEDERFGGGRGEDAMPIEEFVLDVIGMRRALGWTPRSRADESQWGATADNVWDMNFRTKEWKKNVFSYIPENSQEALRRQQEDVDYADKVIEWAKSLKETEGGTDLDDYLWNLSAAAGQPIVTRGTAGLVGSALNAYDRAHQTVDTDKVGQVIFFSGNIIDKRTTRFESLMWKFENEAGEKFVFFSRNSDLDAQLDQLRSENTPIYAEAIFKKRTVFSGQEEITVDNVRLINEEEFFEGKATEEEAAGKAKEEQAANPVAAGLQDIYLTYDGIKHTMEGDYGTRYKHAFRDDLGRPFVWWTGNRIPLSEGKRYDLRGTVKGVKGEDAVPHPSDHRFDPGAYELQRVKFRAEVDEEGNPIDPQGRVEQATAELEAAQQALSIVNPDKRNPDGSTLPEYNLVKPILDIMNDIRYDKIIMSKEIPAAIQTLDATIAALNPESFEESANVYFRTTNIDLDDPNQEQFPDRSEDFQRKFRYHQEATNILNAAMVDVIMGLRGNNIYIGGEDVMSELVSKYGREGEENPGLEGFEGYYRPMLEKVKTGLNGMIEFINSVKTVATTALPTLIEANEKVQKYNDQAAIAIKPRKKKKTKKKKKASLVDVRMGFPNRSLGEYIASLTRPVQVKMAGFPEE